MFETILTGILPILMIVAAASDVTTYRIPNWLTGLTAFAFLPVAYLSGMPMAEFGSHLLTGIVLFVVGYIFFTLRLFGGGDAKLMAAAGLWFGFGQSLNFLFLTVLAGGVLALAVALLALIQMHFDISGASFGQSLKKLSPKVPYGLALAVGAILAFPQTWIMQHVA